MTPSPVNPTLSWASDRCLRVVVGSDPSVETHRRVRAAMASLNAAAIPGVLDITPAYATLLLTFDLAALDPALAQTRVSGALGALESAPGADVPRTVEVPVCYEGECAPDLESVAAHCKLSPGQVAALHSGAEYLVHFIGFTPGFPYLGGLPAALSVPRLEKPRTRVPAGSVAIGGDQTGIYPHATPGGWRLIGRTPLRLFDPARANPSLLELGDRVRLVPIGLDEFKARDEQSSSGGRS